jgi:hypothetical protein
VWTQGHPVVHGVWRVQQVWVMNDHTNKKKKENIIMMWYGVVCIK